MALFPRVSRDRSAKRRYAIYYYKIVGGFRFYERAEIRDALAYLRVIAQPADDLAFERIVNTPKRGLGDKAVAAIHRHARASGQPLLLAAAQMLDSDELTPQARRSLGRFVGDLARWVGFLLDAWPPRDGAERGPLRRASAREMQRRRSPDRGGRFPGRVVGETPHIGARSERNEGMLHSGFAFPVIADGEVVAVAEFLNPEISQPDDGLLRTVTAIGHQIGRH